jgi:ribosomal protein S12 methylthiotransferase accessory factor
MLETRTKTTNQTLHNAKLVAQKIGVTRTPNVTGLDYLGIPVWLAIRPSAKQYAVSAGKGLTDEQAQVSALMESIEVWHAENVCPPTLLTSYNKAKNAQAMLNPKLFANSDYDLAPLLDLNIAWQTAYGLNSNVHNPDKLLIPRAAVSLNSVDERTIAAAIINPTGNGLASGNTKAEALCYSLLEIIERHNCAQLKYKQPQTIKQIDLATISDTSLQQLIQQITRKGFALQVFNCSEEIAVPSFLCILSDKQKNQGIHSYTGRAAHFDKNIALKKAIVEAAQIRLTYIAGARDDIYPSYYAEEQAVSEQSYQTEDFQCLATLDYFGIDFEKNLQLLLQLLKQAGFAQAFYFDHFKQEIGIPVVHSFVPGAECDE